MGGDVFRALADPNRRLILDELAERDGQTLFELCTRLISRHGVAISRQAVSQHLEVLEEAGLVRSHRVGRTKVHEIDTAPIGQAVARWLPPRPSRPAPPGRPAPSSRPQTPSRPQTKEQP